MSVGITVIDKLSIASDLSNLSLVEGLVDKVCASLSIDEDLYGNILIAVTEAVNNAIIHGNKFSSDLQVLIDVLEDEQSFLFRITDFGSGFDFENLHQNFFVAIPVNLQFLKAIQNIYFY